MRKIKLNHGKLSLIDNEDYKIVRGYKWRAKFEHNNWYVLANERGKTIRMHRLILGIEDSVIITDHIDGNGLNNQRSNLRVCTKQQNCFNRKVSKNSESKYKGVGILKDKRKKRYVAYISINGKRKILGYFYTKESAAERYNIEAKELFGEFARLNIIK